MYTVLSDSLQAVFRRGCERSPLVVIFAMYYCASTRFVFSVLNASLNTLKHNREMRSHFPRNADDHDSSLKKIVSVRS